MGKYLRRKKAIAIVKIWLRHIGEWTRIKAACKRLVRSVTTLQRLYRAWLVHKRKNCEVIGKTWQRVEDEHLMQYFKVFAKRIAHEIRTAEEKGPGSSNSAFKKQKSNSMIQGGKKKANLNPEKFIEDNLNWKAYRIPVDVRKRAINTYYLKQLRK